MESPLRLLKRIWTATWKIILFLLVWGVLYAPAALLIPLEPREVGAAISPELRIYLELHGAVAVLLAAWILARFADRRSFVSLGFAREGVVRDLLLGLAVGAAMISLAIALLGLAGWAEATPAPAFSWAVLGLTATAMLLNSVTQEVLVRGWMLQTIEAQSNAPTAVAISAVLFALLHAGAIAEGGVLPGINLLAAGVLLGVAYTTTHNLWLPIALHFSWNFLQGPVLGIAVSGQALDSGWKLVELAGPALVTGGAFGLEGGLAATLVTALGIAALILMGRRRGAPEAPGR